MPKPTYRSASPEWSLHLRESGHDIYYTKAGRQKILWEDYFGRVTDKSERTDPDYVERVDQKNLRIYLSLAASHQKVFLDGLSGPERKALRDLLRQVEEVRTSSAETLTGRRDNRLFSGEVTEINRELIAVLKKHPDRMYRLHPRMFEKLVAEILRDMGCEVELTPCTRDGGRDVLATFPTPVGRMLTIVECKRYSAERKLGIDVVERFMWTLERKDKASCGLIATTSFFSAEAHAIAREYEYRLRLRDFGGVKDWIGNYGTWIKSDNSALWIPAK